MKEQDNLECHRLSQTFLPLDQMLVKLTSAESELRTGMPGGIYQDGNPARGGRV